jgi:predicted RNA binding protein YcfA (HicA-like mRNA interferase family)
VTDLSRELLDRLRQAGYEFVRHGKGSHDIWRDPAAGKAIAIPHKIPSHHFANKLLRTSF